METKNTTIGYLVGKEVFSPGEGDNPNFFNFPQKFFTTEKEALDAFEKEIEEIKMAKLEKDFASDKREEYYDMLGEIQAITSWIQELTKIETEKEIENVAKELCKMCYEIKNV